MLLLVGILASSCGTVKKSATSENSTNYTIKYVPISGNYYEGNFIVEVFDSKGEALAGSKISIYTNGELTSELDLTSTTGVFYKEEITTLTVRVTKEGFADVETELITTKSDKACFLSVQLSKK